MMFDKRIIELISLGAAVSANCQPCLQYHIDKALEAGITEEELREAIEVGRTVRKGAAAKMDQLVSQRNGSSPKAACGETKGCGCAS